MRTARSALPHSKFHRDRSSESRQLPLQRAKIHAGFDWSHDGRIARETTSRNVCGSYGGAAFTCLSSPKDPCPSGPVFTGDAQHLIVELLAEKERRCEQLVEFGTNGSNVARPLGLEKETKSANHIEARRLGQSSCGAIVDDNRAGLHLDSQGDGLPLAVTKPSSQREPRRGLRRCPHLQPPWKDRDRRRNLPSYSRRNQRRLENGRNEIEALNSGESDQWAGVRDDRHSELLDGLKLPQQLFTLELEVRNAPFRGVANELLALHAKQLRGPSAGYFALTIKFENDQLPSRLLGGSLELLEELDEVLVELDGNGFHDRLGEQIVHPVTGVRSMLSTASGRSPAHGRDCSSHPLGCPSKQHDSRSDGRAQQRRGRGNTDAGAVFPLFTERDAPMHTHAAHSCGDGVA